jgi:hypothetical protein
MAIRIPNLTHSYLVVVNYCAYIDSARTNRAAEAIRETGRVEIECDVEADNSPDRIGLIVELDRDNDVHVHVEFARRDSIVGEILPEESGSIDDWQRAIGRLHGYPLNLFVSGLYKLPWKDVPAGGLVRGLSSISTETGSVTLSLTGAEIAIKGPSPYRRITWSKSKDSLRGEVFARTEVVLSDTYLEDGLKLLNDGIRRFILEEKDVAGA